MTEQPIVELVDVAKTYASGAQALEGFNLTLADGEFVSLLGPSGCGKSTVLRIIAGLSEPTRGVVRRTWDRKAPSNEKVSAQQPVACVFQEPTLLPWRSVWQNVFLPLQLQGVGKKAAVPKIEEALKLVGLERFANALPRQLSGGMKMRASIARALLTNPTLLLLDEPFAALDEITRNRLNDDLLSIWQQRRWTGLFITHSVFESVYLSTRILVMSPRPGRVVDEIVVDLPAARSADTRRSPQYIELCRRVSLALEQAAANAAEPVHA
jgi:NitT/TauT family transport system ATP-binding protein